jgi:thiol-disulfide isomerase/thioredoxin
MSEQLGLWSRFLAAFRRNRRFLFLLLLMVSGVHLWQTWSVPSGQIPGELLDLRSEWIDRDGQTRILTLAEGIEAARAAVPGRAVAVHVWAEWCSICKLEESSISSLVGDHPVVTVAVQSGAAVRVKDHMLRRGFAWPVWVDSDGRLLDILGFRAVPAFFIVDQRGAIRFPSVGYTTEIGMRVRLLFANWLTSLS